MPVLKTMGAVMLASLAFVSCTPRAALTPEDAYLDFKLAVKRSDGRALAEQLSAASLRKVTAMTGMLAKMDERQATAVAARYGVKPERLRRLSAADFMTVSLAAEGGSNIYKQAASQRLVGIERQGTRAVARLENGMFLSFIKEGPYWKLDLEGL